MGIYNFKKHLESLGITQDMYVTKLKSNQFKYVFVDFSIVYMAFATTLSAHRKPGVLLDPRKRGMSIATMARYIYNELNDLKVPNIYIVLDGEAPVEKVNEHLKRTKASTIRRIGAIKKFYNTGKSQEYLKAMRQSNPAIFSPPNYREEVAQEVNRLGFPIIRAECEAEAMCVGLAYKFRSHRAAVYTRDTDVYCMGNAFTIWRSISSDKYNRRIFSFKKLLAAFRAHIIDNRISTTCTPDQFKKVCILLGCDFTSIKLDIHVAINIVFERIDLSLNGKYLSAWKDMKQIQQLFDHNNTGINTLKYSKCPKTGHCIITHPTRVVHKSKNTIPADSIEIKVVPDLEKLDSVF